MKYEGLGPEQMVKAAEAAIRAGTLMTLVLPRRRGKIPRKFPHGKLLCGNINGWNIYTPDPFKVLAWLAANGLTASGSSDADGAAARDPQNAPRCSSTR